jgi:DNA-binding transcriptional regulator GbsR (MarR family)
VALISSRPWAEADSSGRLVRPAARSAEVAEFEEATVSFFVNAADLIGIPKSVAAIYGSCFASPEPLNFADIERGLKISKGSISQGLRILCEMGALKKVSRPSERRDYFAPDLELRKLIRRWIEERLQKQLSAGLGRLEYLAESVPASRSASGKVLRIRIKSLQNWHKKGRALMPVIKAFLRVT